MQEVDACAAPKTTGPRGLPAEALVRDNEPAYSAAALAAGAALS